MLKQLIPALKATLIIATLVGIFFPAIITLLAQSLFPEQANGSLVKDKNGQILGSKILGQSFTKPEYFQPRPSAAGAGYCGEISSGTNLGTTSAKLILGQKDDPLTHDVDESFNGIKQLTAQYHQNNFLTEEEKVPVDAVTRSGSGLDPDISIDNATLQARRVAKARGLPPEKITELITNNTEHRQFGILGEPRVNVLMLNLVLDRLSVKANE